MDKRIFFWGMIILLCGIVFGAGFALNYTQEQVDSLTSKEIWDNTIYKPCTVEQNGIYFIMHCEIATISHGDKDYVITPIDKQIVFSQAELEECAILFGSKSKCNLKYVLEKKNSLLGSERESEYKKVLAYQNLTKEDTDWKTDDFSMDVNGVNKLPEPSVIK